MTSATIPQNQHKKRILVVEDEPGMLMGLEHNLTFEGYAVSTAADGKQGLEMALADPPDLVLLDVMLPEMSGFEVLKVIRENNPSLPVIMLTAKGLESDKVQGFGLGADDYVTKPFSIAELTARISAVMRRTGVDKGPSLFQFGDIEINFEKHECSKRGKPVSLSFKEFELLALLIRKRGQTVTREELLKEVWGKDAEDTPTSRTVDTHVANLRKKIEGDRDRNRWIRTVHKVGYRFAGEDEV